MRDSSRFSADGGAGEQSAGVQSVHLLSEDGERGYSESGHEGYVLFGRQHPHQGTARYGGGVPKRQGTSILDFLESRRIGINLTGANYVIHLDPWWNPAIEQQATDRAYRIGQNQKVTVYHLIAEHTIEEKILRLHQTKQSLADSLLEGTTCRTNSPRKTSWNCLAENQDA